MPIQQYRVSCGIFEWYTSTGENWLSWRKTVQYTWRKLVYLLSVYKRLFLSNCRDLNPHYSNHLEYFAIGALFELVSVSKRALFLYPKLSKESGCQLVGLTRPHKLMPFYFRKNK